MKNTFKLVLLASLVVFAAACGKKNESGGGGSSFSSLTGGVDLSQSSATALRNFQRWYDGREEGTTLYNGVGNYALTYENNISSANGSAIPENCEQKGWWIFKVLICEGTSSSANASDCMVTGNVASDRSIKHLNPSLRAILTGSYGTLVEVSQSGGSGTVIGPVYVLKFQQQNGSVINFVIDTKYHSSVQPVQLNDYGTGNSSVLRNIQYIYNGAQLDSCHDRT